MKSPSKATPTKATQRSILSFFSTPPSNSQTIDNVQNASPSVQSDVFVSPSVSKKFRILDDDDGDDSGQNRSSGEPQKTPLKEIKKGSIDFSSFSSPSHSSLSSPSTGLDAKKGKKDETRYQWLVNIRDKEGNPPEHPNYNPKTLYIPPSQWKSFTPFERQYWEIKSNHYDCLVFFKKGKFYELYESDADVGTREFDLKITDRVNMRMAGIPEASFDYWTGKFIARGYKVAKVEQMENGIEKEMREQGNEDGERDKIIKRELACVLTGGTIMDAGLLTSDLASYCLCLKFAPVASSAGEVRVSAVFVDTASGKFFVCNSFVEDGRHFTQLETLIAQIRPKEIVAEQRGIPPTVVKMIKNALLNPILSYTAGKFWSPEKFRMELEAKKYFDTLPQLLSTLQLEDIDAFQCFGGLVEYLATLKLDTLLLSYESILPYSIRETEQFLEIDGQTLLNLEIFQNCIDGGEEGTLIRLLDNCLTPFGKRLFRFWVAHPLCNPEQIKQRLNCVELLFTNPQFTAFLKRLLQNLPDLERIGCRIHAKSCKLSDFLLALEKWRCIINVLDDEIALLNSLDISTLFHQLLCVNLPKEKLSEIIDSLYRGFDVGQAKTEGAIVPSAGAFPEYDQACEQLQRVEARLDEYLTEQRAKFRCPQIQYKDLGKELFQLEVPAEYCQSVTNDYVVMSKTKAVYRYWTCELKGMVKEYQHAVERKKGLTGSIYQRFLELYDSHHSVWSDAVYILAQVDCLYSLFKASSMHGSCTKPSIIASLTGESYLSIQDGIHPCVPNCIPNSVTIGRAESDSESPLMILLTGPNMGGKSTLLRQVCIQAILAQIGCYCPAAQVTLVPFTRIFTRIGANDNIMNGQSTFMVELAETARILHNADERSLVILDELGRGTSTYDGYAIAYASLHYLLNYRRTRGLFSTHYHMLGQEMAHYTHLSQCHMGYIVMDKGDALTNQVVFLYQLTKGACDQSFGMNVARMAGISEPLIQQAQQVADEFERLSILKGVNQTTLHDQLPVAHQVDEQYLKVGALDLSPASLALIQQTIDAYSPAKK